MALAPKDLKIRLDGESNDKKILDKFSTENDTPAYVPFETDVI